MWLSTFIYCLVLLNVIALLKMKASLASSVLATAVVSISSIASGLNIIVSNDDGFGSANIREFYKALKAAGHNAWIVAPVVDMSGKGGTVCDCLSIGSNPA